MATVEMVMPRMGESIMEGTILKWLKKEGDPVEQDESVLEVATDKVDTEVPATHSGVLQKILAEEGDVVQIDHPIAIIAQEGNGQVAHSKEAAEKPKKEAPSVPEEAAAAPEHESEIPVVDVGRSQPNEQPSGRFYSPLVMNIARKEGISMQMLETITGSGKEGRVTKKDILQFLDSEDHHKKAQPAATTSAPTVEKRPVPSVSINVGAQDEVIEMNRMRKMIAERMLDSQRISAHVTSFVEADVTNLVLWRNKVKDDYRKKENENFTFTPIFMEAVAQAIKDFPMINVSVDGHNIIKRKHINIGMAVALPNSNLIVPVVRDADQLSLLGLSKKVNELAERARQHKLTADNLADGTYTVSNIGSFGNILGTPMIMQPQVAILALGAIIKKPSVIETSTGDAIAIRHKMYLSHSYDHRVVDGALGGMFVRRVADLLENFDIDRKL